MKRRYIKEKGWEEKETCDWSECLRFMLSGYTDVGIVLELVYLYMVEEITCV